MKYLIVLTLLIASTPVFAGDDPIQPGNPCNIYPEICDPPPPPCPAFPECVIDSVSFLSKKKDRPKSRKHHCLINEGHWDEETQTCKNAQQRLA